jgi:hypothetical protein
MQANSVEEVLELIDELIIRFKEDQNPLGYFAAIYKMTTQKVHDLVEKGAFQDNERMKRMDVIFANRYFKAMTQFFENEPASGPWQMAFDAIRNKDLIVDQHFFLSANAHINYDLSIAAAETCPGNLIHDFADDFNTMNEVLGSLYTKVNYDIAKIYSPLYRWLRWFSNLMLKLENAFMIRERDDAWANAVFFATHPPAEKEQHQAQLEQKSANMGHRISHPGLILRLICRHISRKEIGTVAYRISCIT